VEQRLEFYESGAAPKKNLDTMRAVIATLEEAGGDAMATDAPAEEEEEEDD
jgi:hypothetical protein